MIVAKFDDFFVSSFKNHNLYNTWEKQCWIKENVCMRITSAWHLIRTTSSSFFLHRLVIAAPFFIRRNRDETKSQTAKEMFLFWMNIYFSIYYSIVFNLSLGSRMISIITTVKNGEAYLSATFDALLSQSFRNFEVSFSFKIATFLFVDLYS